VTVEYVFAGLVVSDRDEAAAWYSRLFGRSPDMLPNEAEAAWQLTESASVYLLADPARAGHGVLTLIVDDLDAELAAIAARDLVTRPAEETPAGRTCKLTDPDGNSIQLAQLA